MFFQTIKQNKARHYKKIMRGSMKQIRCRYESSLIWEPDNTGSINNYLARTDMVYSAETDHANGTEGYDY